MDARRYKPIYAWRTLCNDVILLTAQTLTDPAVFRVSIKPIDINEPGSLELVTVGMYLKDFVGHTYRISNVVSQLIIDVVDDFWVNIGPQSGRQAIVFKSVWGNRGPYLAPIYYRHLDKSALEYSRQMELDILWSNDPNTRRINFVSTDSPSLTDYQGFYASDYGENPKIQLWQIDGSNNIIERTEKPYYIISGGLIQSITFGTLDEVMTGYILISK